MRVKDVMDKDVIRIDESTTVIQAVQKMVDSGVWSLLIERNQLPTGVLTERDIIRRAVVKGLSLDKVKVAEIMSAPIITVDPNASIGEAMELMTLKSVRRLFVLENGKIMGRITQTELFNNNLNVMLSLSSMRYQI